MSSRVLRSQPAGIAHFSFDGRDAAGRALASGIYFCRASANGNSVTKKMVLVR